MLREYCTKRGPVVIISNLDDVTDIFVLNDNVIFHLLPYTAMD